jgi:hypothetical protein
VNINLLSRNNTGDFLEALQSGTSATTGTAIRQTCCSDYKISVVKNENQVLAIAVRPVAASCESGEDKHGSSFSLVYFEISDVSVIFLETTEEGNISIMHALTLSLFVSSIGKEFCFINILFVFCEMKQTVSKKSKEAEACFLVI